LLDGAPLPLGGPKQRATLAELLLHAGEVVTRDHLVDAVWGEQPPGNAAASLQVYVHGLRRALGPERIETHGNGYRLRLDGDELDLHRFERLVERGARALAAGRPAEAADDLRTALALFAGEPLADLAGQPVAAAAAAIEERRLQALELHGDAQLALGGHAALLGELDELIRRQPYRERLRAQQILALYRCGRQKDALDAYRDARATLVDELGVEPGPELQELERAVLRQDPALAPPAPAEPVTTRLPRPPTPLVGRRLEVAAVAGLLRAESRLVTLTGPGGTGKTRLALAVAEELAGESGGAVFVDLAPVGDPALVMDAIAQALDVADQGSLPAGIADAMAERPLLLVLDNFEQLLAAAPEVAALLAAAPRLRALVTSRAPLRLAGEREYPVPPLPVPPPRASFEELVSNETVRLFAARAQAVDPGFTLDDANAEAVAAICRRLEGLPLAIELTAVRVRLLPPFDLARRLEQGLDLSAEGARDLPARQRTLRATLDWSYGLLPEREQRVLRRLAVFAGGCSLDAAEAVVGEGDLVSSLELLVEHSLLRRRGDPLRFRLLAPIREYALERLVEAGEEAEVRERHAQHFLAATEAIDTSALDERMLGELDREHDNLRAALEWSAATGAVVSEVRLASVLRHYWFVRGYLNEGRYYLSRAIASSANGPPTEHALALIHGAAFAYRLGLLGDARAELERALQIYTELGDRSSTAWCRSELGNVAYTEGRLDDAAELYSSAAEFFAAEPNVYRRALALSNLAEVLRTQGRLEEAAQTIEEALTLQHGRGELDLDAVAISVHNLARIRLALGDRDEARRLIAECFDLAQRVGFREVIAYGVEMVAELALAAGDLERALRMLALSESLFAQIGTQMQGEEQQDYERTLADVRGRLGDDALAAARAAAAGAPVDVARREALATLAAADGV